MWWSNRYNKPLKDPTLQSYTLEELAYEHYLFSEMKTLNDKAIEEENDMIEEGRVRSDEEWADEMEREEAEMEAAKEVQDPSSNPENVKWMEEEMNRQKELYGEDFGEDIVSDFEGL